MPRVFDPQATVVPIMVKYETVCSRCERKVLKGEAATWESYKDKREELRPKRRIVCTDCEPPKSRSSGVRSNPAKRGSKNFRDYLRQEQEKKTA